MILDELRSSWLQYSDGELAAYDDYPTLVKMIMHVSGAADESDRKVARDIIVKLAPEERHQASTDAESPAMALVRHQTMLQT